MRTTTWDPDRDGDSADRAPRLGGFLLDREALLPEVRRLSGIDNAKGAWSILRQWLVIAVAIGVALWSRNGMVWLAAVVIIATRQHALMIIMHEAAHYRLFTNRRVNELASDWFCAYPVGLATQLYRKHHLDHHRFTNTDGDPNWVQMRELEDWAWPKDHVACARLFVKDVVGLHAHKFLSIMTNWSPWPRVVRMPSESRADNPLGPQEQRRWLLFVAVVITFLATTRSWVPFLVLWIVPLLTVTGALFRMRTVSEHLVLDGTDELNSTRHVEATMLERLSIAPLNANYHLAHHLFPSVPQYNLPQLHRILMENAAFRDHAACVKRYLGISDGVLGAILRRTD